MMTKFKQLNLTNEMSDFIKTSFGNIIEWYDFTIYGLFALQISKTFFPNDNRLISLLLIFATFAIGFLARPLGSIFFGVIGDKYGKNYSVNLSIWLMAIPTALIGLLPSYAQIGFLSPLLLIFLRICQGISAGGQFSGLIAIAVDKYKPNQSILVSLIYSISVLGCFFASFIGYLAICIVNHFSPESLFTKSLVWRVPFLLSLVLFIVYNKMIPHVEKDEVKNDNDFKLREIVREQPQIFVCMVLLSLTTGMIYYILFTYLITYMQLHAGLNKQIAFFIMNGILVFSIILYPVFGYYANKHESKIHNAQYYSLALLAAGGLFGLSSMNLWFGIISVLLMVVFFCAITAFTTSYYAEAFAARYRMTACSISFNVGMSVAGCAPLLAELFSSISNFGLPLFISLIAFVMYIVLFLLKSFLQVELCTIKK